MHGLGNSYVYIDARQVKISDKQLPQFAIEVAQPGVGIGSDGLIWIGPSQVATVKMRIFNKDGSEAENCGNGLRCVAKYAYEQMSAPKEMTIETKGGIYQATILSHTPLEASVAVDIGAPKFSKAETLQIQAQTITFTPVSVGNPHAVLFVEKSNDELVRQLGPQIERHPRFPEGVNVEFVHVRSPISLRCGVWERGSGMTQACGTGACAAAVAAVLNGYCKKDSAIEVQLLGGTLTICWQTDGRIVMTGPATTAATGCFLRASS